VVSTKDFPQWGSPKGVPLRGVNHGGTARGFAQGVFPKGGFPRVVQQVGSTKGCPRWGVPKGAYTKRGGIRSVVLQRGSPRWVC
jgi:hypothetical protein